MAVVSSAGRVTDTGPPVWSAPSGAAGWGTLETLDAQRRTVAYGELYRAQPSVRTVVSFLARNVAQLGLKAYDRVGDYDRAPLDRTHPFSRLLRRPDLTAPSAYRWKLALVSDLAIYDVAYFVKVRDRAAGSVFALLRLPPERVRPIGSSWFWPEGFELIGSRSSLVLRADEVFAMRGYNPLDPKTGSSPIESLRAALGEEDAATRYAEQLWRRGARVSGWIERPGDAPAWSGEAKRRFSASWRSAYTGSAGSDAGGTPVLEDGMSFHESSHSPREAQLTEGRRLTLESVAIAYHIPPTLIGVLQHATFSNIEHQHRHLYQDTLGPWLTWIEEEVNGQLLPEFADLDPDQVYAEFNLAEKLRGSFAEQMASYQTAVGAPFMTRNEARAGLNLPAVDGGDDMVTPLNVLIGGQASPTDSAPEPEDTTGELAADEADYGLKLLERLANAGADPAALAAGAETL